MAQWPKEPVWPDEHREHASSLAKYFGDTLSCITNSQSQTVPASHFKAIMTGTITLINKVNRMPDVSSVRDTLNTMQAESKATAQETTKTLENIRMEIHKSNATGEEAKAAAKEAADIGKTVAGMARDIKNSGTQGGASFPMSYAAAAASGTLASSVHNVQSAKTISSQTQREVVVNIRDVLTIQNLRAMNPRNLKSHVERAIEQSGNENIVNMRVMSANQLKSGDLSIRTATNSEALVIRQHAGDWAHLIGNGSSVRTPTYGVLVHGVRTRSMDMAKFEENKENILQENRPFIPRAEIKFMGWLTRTGPTKSMSSVIVEFSRAEDANKIIDEGLVWQGELMQCERYDRQCRLRQCFNCQKYGHIGTQCKATTACGYCALDHESRNCPSKTERTGPRKCVVCQGEHEAWSQQCPARKEEMVRTKAAYASRPRYHPVVIAQRSTSQHGSTTGVLRRKRSARDLGQQPDTGVEGDASLIGRGHKRTNTGIQPTSTDKENESPAGTGSQRPQRAISLSRRALEALESNRAVRTNSQQMDIDAESDS